jgi:hypothetical protein
MNVMKGTGKYGAQISGRQQGSPMYLVAKRCQVDMTFSKLWIQFGPERLNVLPHLSSDESARDTEEISVIYEKHRE